MATARDAQPWGREGTSTMIKGGYTPIASEAVPASPPRARRVAVRLTLLFVASGLGPVAAALGLAAYHGGARAILVAALVSALALGASVAAARWMARSITRPITALSSAADHLGGGAFGEQVVEQGPAELVELARSWNGASRRLAAASEEN